MEYRYQQVNVLRVPGARFAIDDLFDLVSGVVHAK
jgi:hypothetical protein